MLTIIKKQLLILLPLFLIACSSSQHSSNRASHYTTTQKAFGKASYYADKYQNRQTASGELFDQYKKTAAHKTLPFGTWVKVTNVNNSRSVVVRINDRGPFVRGRIIDLSKSAFSAIENIRLGVIEVMVEVVN
jgi:rare lipoprotein A